MIRVLSSWQGYSQCLDGTWRRTVKVGTVIKIVDTRDSTMFTGVLEKELPAGQEVSQADMREYYKMTPSDRHYEVVRRPVSHNRVVLRRGDDAVDDEISYYIIPDYPFYKRIQ